VGLLDQSVPEHLRFCYHPALIAAGGMSAIAATATSTWATLFTGVAGTGAYAWRDVIAWRMLLHLTAGMCLQPSWARG
jgi:uncharacterized membrane protein YfcA